MNAIADRVGGQIQRSSPTPLYAQIARIIRTLIDDGTFKPGDPIPSENEISQFTGISRMTVRRGLQELVREGVLVTVSGRGYFAGSRRIEMTTGVLRGFTEEISAMGLTPSSTVIEKTVTYGDPVAHLVFGTSVGSPILKITRVRSGDGIPLALETAFYDLSICRGLERLDVDRSVYDILRHELGINLDTATQTLNAAVIDDGQAQVLRVPRGLPALRITRRTYNSEAALVEYVEAVFRGDRYTFSVTLR